MPLFAKRIFLVTGASGGVGGAIARRLGDNGATVWLSGRNLERLNRLAEQVPSKRGRPIPGDLTVEHEFQEVVRQVLAGGEHPGRHCPLRGDDLAGLLCHSLEGRF